MIVYISIGNNDDKLSQREWSNFYHDVDADMGTAGYGSIVHSAWQSQPSAPYQNACWCIELRAADVPDLKSRLAVAAKYYRQNSIAWAEVSAAEFITPNMATSEST